MLTFKKLALSSLTALIALNTVSIARAKPINQPQQLLSLNAQAQTDVKQDIVTITLFDEQQNAQANVLTEALNQRTQQVLNRAKQQQAVQSFSGQFSIYPTNDKGNKINGWRGRSEVILRSNNFTAASKLAGELSKLMQIANISFSLSEGQQQKVQQSLIQQVVKNFQKKAALTAQALGYKTYHIHEISLGDNYPTPRSSPITMLAAARYSGNSAPLAIDPGKTTVSVHLQGSVQLLK